MSTVEIKPSVPLEAIYPSLTSSSKHIVSRRLQEIRPVANVAFSYSTNNQIEFNITSPKDFFDAMNSYVRMDVTCSLNNGGSDATRKYLAEGGAHSLFRTLEIYTGSGTLVQRIDRYNKFYQIMSQALHSQDYVDSQLSRALDSVEAIPEEPEVISDITYVAAEANYDHTGGAAEQLLVLASTALSAKAKSEIQVGDLLRVETAVLNYTCRVLTIVDELSVTVEGLPASDIAAAAILNIQKIKAPRKVDPMRKVAANTSSIVACFQPMAPFLNIQEWIPIFLFQGGLRMVFTLERPEFVLSCPQEPILGTGYSGADVSVANPVFMTSFVSVDDNLMSDVMDKYKSSGLSIPFLSIDHYLDIQAGGGVGTYVSQLNANARSARYVLTKIQNSRAETVSSATANSGKSTFTCDSVAQGLKAGLSSYLVSSGSERFPTSKPIDTTDVSNNEVLLEFERATSSMGKSHRFKAVQWHERSSFVNEYEATEIADSQRLVLGSDLARYSSPFAGLDLSLNPIRVEMEFDAQYQLTDKDGSSNAANADRYFHHFLVSDALVSISQNGVAVYK